jgi:tRNA pseudouridine38-40 synthase
MTGREVSITCAGRTDTGVHALGQVVHVDLDEGAVSKWARREHVELEPWTRLERLAMSLSHQLGPAVSVLEARVAPQGFHARHSAIARRYRYELARASWVNPLTQHMCWHVPGALDLAAMRIASDALLGEHDFSAFGRQPPGGEGPMVRRVLVADWSAVHGFEPRWSFTIEANAFCHQMVRSIVGTLVAVGKGRIRAGEMLSIIHGRDRSRAADLAPAKGLCLEGVRYGDTLVPGGVWKADATA